jgi:hypothetical protein
MEEVGEKVGRMLSEKASRDKNPKETGEETTIEGLTKKYPWWMPTAHVRRAITPSNKTETQPPCSRARIRECEDST